MRLILIALIGILITGCGDSGAQARSAEEMAVLAERARDLQPDDARLAEVYGRSCANCHAIAASGAPLTGDAVGWAPRIAKGETVMLESTIAGFAGMPPMGLCPDCSATEFRDLIIFMSTDPE